jgi:hypothetical protein
LTAVNTSTTGFASDVEAREGPGQTAPQSPGTRPNDNRFAPQASPEVSGRLLKLRRLARKQVIEPFLAEFDHRYVWLAALAVIVGLFISLILVFTSGKLLYGSDYPGVYSLSDLPISPTPSTLLTAVCITLGAGNIYLGFYFAYAVSAWLCLVGIFLLAQEIGRDVLPEGLWKWCGLTAATLFLFSPSAFFDSYTSLMTNVSLYAAGFLLFLFCLVRWFRSRRGNVQCTYRTAVCAGLGLGLSLQLLPTNLRTAAVAILLFGFLFAWTLGGSVIHGRRPRFSRKSIYLAVTVVLATMAAGAYSIVLTLQGFPQLSQTIQAAAGGHSATLYYVGAFNTVPYVMLLLGSWGFPAVQYSSLYYSIGIVSMAAALWPILALVVPMLVFRGSRRFVLYPWLVLTMLGLFWEKASNPPFGGFWQALVSSVPDGTQVLPTHFLSTLLLSNLYVALAAISIIGIYQRLRSVVARSPTVAPSTPRTDRLPPGRVLGATIVSFLLVGALLIAAMPVLSGAAETQMWNHPGVEGDFAIPAAYVGARSLAERGGGTTLILPGMGSYVRLSWGYYGVSSFYVEYFAPAEVYTLYSVGGTYATSSGLQSYAHITQPLIWNGTSETYELNTTWESLVRSIGISSILVDGYLDEGGLDNESYQQAIVPILLETGAGVDLTNSGSLAFITLNS